MASESPPERSRPVPETAVQQSILQQAQAAAAAQTDSTTPTTQDALLLEADLLAHDAGEDDGPPPAYGDTYGEIRNEKDGLGTSARVTDDGRVNIRINQLNRRLSQVFTPALRQHVQSVQDSQPPPPPYIPPSLGGDDKTPPPPPLNVVIQVVGSRGDVQPFVALGKVLKDTYGHRVRLATHPNFKDFVQENGLEFFSIGGDPSQLMAYMVKNPGLMPGFRSVMSGDVGQRKKDVAQYIQGCWRSCYKAGDGMESDELSEPSGNDPAARPFVADCIIANPPSFAHIHCAEKLGIPLHMMFTMPYSPTQAFPHPLANIQSNADPQLTNYISYAMIEVLSWQGLGEIINRFRRKCLGLDPVSLIWAPGMLQRLKVPHTYCWSPALIPKPKDWGAHISIAGFYKLASDYTPAPDLQTFLKAGPPPVYIGFGSIVLDNPNAMTELIFEAVRKTGQRVLLSKGWGGMGAVELLLRVPDGVFMLGNVPHDWLFEHVSCVVHHGGAGTTAAGITAGRPTLVVPFFGDQPFWGAMVARAGAGPDPIPHKQLTADNLADAINFCLRPASLERAKELASKIAAERGSDVGAQSFHQHLEVDRLRCSLAPSRAAAWRIKRTKVRLSTFTACTLANASLLDFHDLKLFRPQEYDTDEGPWDPISGFGAATFGAFSNMVMGLADFPSETWKAVQIPYASSRQQSQASVPTITRKSETLHVGEGPGSPARNQTSSNVQESLADVRSPSKLSRRSSQTSNVASGSKSSVQDELGPGRGDASRGQFRRSKTSSSVKDQDMMRQTRAHTSKGFGRMAKAALEAPMDMAVGITRGFHNAPKMWGDTVRPQEQVSGVKSGARAIGREFGFGMYDGVTGLVTQPWKGAQKDGAAGFFKGFGKGVGGLFAKPGAALFSIPAYLMRGVYKEVQGMFGSNVQSYIIASRAAQGYEEWLQSSDAEKQDVIDRWKLIQMYLKKRSPDEMMQDALEAQRKETIEDRDARQSYERTSRSTLSAKSADDPIQGSGRAMFATSEIQSPLRSTRTSKDTLGVGDINDTSQSPVEQVSRGGTEDNADAVQALQKTVSQLQRQRKEVSAPQADQQQLRQAMASSEAEAHRYTIEAREHQKRLELIMEQSAREKSQQNSESDSGNDSELRSIRGLDDEEDEEFERANGRFDTTSEKAAAVAGGSSDIQRPPAYDQRHLAGTTQFEFEAQQQGEKTAQEKTEEEIVTAYIKKQSLLEVLHHNKGKGRATATEDEGDEDLQMALKASMQDD